MMLKSPFDIDRNVARRNSGMMSWKEIVGYHDSCNAKCRGDNNRCCLSISVSLTYVLEVPNMVSHEI